MTANKVSQARIRPAGSFSLLTNVGRTSGMRHRRRSAIAATEEAPHVRASRERDGDESLDKDAPLIHRPR